MSRTHGFAGRRSHAPREAFFFCAAERPRAGLAIQLGAQITSAGRIKHNHRYESTIPGCFTAGNLTKGLQMAIAAAVEDALAGHSINKDLHKDSVAQLVSK